MTAWNDVERAQPEFAQRVRGLFDGHRHQTIATLRAGGSPRISGIEVAFEEGELAFGSMPNARKGADLGRDPVDEGGPVLDALEPALHDHGQLMGRAARVTCDRIATASPSAKGPA